MHGSPGVPPSAAQNPLGLPSSTPAGVIFLFFLFFSEFELVTGEFGQINESSSLFNPTANGGDHCEPYWAIHAGSNGPHMQPTPPQAARRAGAAPYPPPPKAAHLAQSAPR